MRKLSFYEILNTVTLEKAQGTAYSFTELCHRLQWKPKDCKLIWKATPESAY